MCGISAILSTTGGRMVDADSVERMNDALVHRGPDANGIKLLTGSTAAVGLGHRRLSIIDLAGGCQPMTNEDGTIWITYNGEVYNHVALRKELTGRGHRYRTRCDTETIIHAYEEWGVACLSRLSGMFAFALWDGRREQLFVARDRMGIKPLYYTHDERCLVCASEVKALLASGWVTPAINFEAVPEHLALGYVAGDATLFRGIKKLLPGHWLLWKEGRIRTEQYWEVPLPDDNSGPHTEADLVDEFLQLFRESVRSRLMSDVPLGVFLSGGLDSSAIAATMAQQMSGPVKTFSVGFESDYYSEFNFARDVAVAIGADHHEVVLTPDRAFASLPRLIWHEDEPIRTASSIALYEVAKLARSQVKVVLTGEGSDELFAGYERYWATLINMRWGSLYHRMIPGWLHRHGVHGTLWRWPIPSSLKRKLSHTFLNHTLRPEEIVFDNWYAIFPPRVQSRLLSAGAWDSLKDVDPYRETMRLYQSRPEHDLLDRLLYTDQKTYLVELLRKQDTMSMAASIESRVPFLDHKLVEFATRVPAPFKIRGLTGKYLVNRAMRQMLPRSILTRKKMGFPVPLNQWFRRGADGIVRRVLLSDQATDRGIFDARFLDQLVCEHSQGTRDRTESLWTLLNFELWARIFIDGQDVSALGDELADTTETPCRGRHVAAAQVS